MLSGLQRYTFCPAAAVVLKKNSPVEQVAGTEVPLLAGLVALAPDASQLPCIVLLPVTVDCAMTAAAVNAQIPNVLFINVFVVS
jgi:hypothetical protein